MISIKKLLILITSLCTVSTTLSGCSFEEFIDEAEKKITEAYDVVVEKAGEIYNETKDFAVDKYNIVSDWVVDAYHTTEEAFIDVGENITQWWTQTTDNIIRIYDDVSTKTVDFAKQSYSAVCGAYETIKDNVISFKNSLINKLRIREANRGTADYELYKDDTETFIYALILNDLNKSYDTFVGKIYLPETSEDTMVLCFTDHKDEFVDANNNKLFGCGFIGLEDEPIISNQDIAKGLEILRVDNDDDTNRYVAMYSAEEFESHFIRNNTYVRYGISEDHQIFFIDEEYSQGTTNIDFVDDGLYNFDTKSWVKGDSSHHLSITGNYLDSILEEINIGNSINLFSDFTFSLAIDDFKGIINKITNLFNNKIGELVTKYPALGFSKKQLRNAVDDMKMSDVIEVNNSDGVEFSINDGQIPQSAKSQPSTLVKWIIGGCAVVSFILTIIMAFAGLPATYTFFSTVMGATIELMVQVVIENNSLQDVNWLNVLIAAIAGALGSLTNNVVLDGVIGAFAGSLMDFVDGANVADCAISFIKSFIIAMVFAGTFHLFSNLLSKLGTKIKKVFNKTTIDAATDVIEAQGATKVASKIDDAIDENSFASSSNKALNNMSNKSSDTLDDVNSAYSKKMMKALVSDKNKYLEKVDSISGKILTKGEIDGIDHSVLVRVKNDLSDDLLNSSVFIKSGLKPGDVIASLDNYHITFLNAFYGSNGIVTVDKMALLEIKHVTRKKLFKLASETMAEYFLENPTNIPSEFSQAFAANKLAITGESVEKIRKQLGYTWHEIDGLQYQLVPTAIHKLVKHAGGFSFIKLLVASGNLQNFILCYA